MQGSVTCTVVTSVRTSLDKKHSEQILKLKGAEIYNKTYILHDTSLTEHGVERAIIYF